MPEYEDIKKSDRVNAAGRACYVERNRWMVSDSVFTLVHFDPALNEKSGTKIIYAFANIAKVFTILV